MQRLTTKKNINQEKQEQIFKKYIKNEEIYKFLLENKLTYTEAINYFSDFKLYEKEPQKYFLKYEYDNVILQVQTAKLNEGLSYLDEPYFIEDKNLEMIDYQQNATKTEIVHQFLKENNQGLYLYSDNGRGKTTLIVALANYKYQLDGKKTLFVFWPDFIEKTKRFDKDNVYFINKVKYASRLIIDDLGQESITQWARDDILNPIINYRLEKKLPTFITSNYTPKELEKIYTFRTVESKKTKSIVQKIMALTTEFLIIGNDLRKDIK